MPIILPMSNQITAQQTCTRPYLGQTIGGADEELAELEPEADVDVVFDGAFE